MLEIKLFLVRYLSSEAMCNGEECPLANLRKLSEEYDFNSACYTTDNDPTERCFTSDVAYIPQVTPTIVMTTSQF